MRSDIEGCYMYGGESLYHIHANSVSKTRFLAWKIESPRVPLYSDQKTSKKYKQTAGLNCKQKQTNR